MGKVKEKKGCEGREGEVDSILFQIEIQSKNNLCLVNVDVSASTEAFLETFRGRLQSRPKRQH